MSNGRTLVLATHNQGKVKEYAVLLQPLKIRVVGLDQFPAVGDIEETGTTFEENALLKACTVSRLTSLPALADDSGLEVDALNGAPGIYSARYSATATSPGNDKKNVVKLLEALENVPFPQRTARFRCSIAICTPSQQSMVVNGTWEGLIAMAPVGTGGFGYDPIFFDPTANITAGEMTPEQKNGRSHRAIAVREFLIAWSAFDRQIGK